MNQMEWLLVSAGKSSWCCDLVEVSGTFWNSYLVYKLDICCIYLLVCNGIYLIPSQTNLQLGFCDSFMTHIVSATNEYFHFFLHFSPVIQYLAQYQQRKAGMSLI